MSIGSVAEFQARVTPADYHYMMYGAHFERMKLLQHLLHYHHEMCGYHAHQMRAEHEQIHQLKMAGALGPAAFEF